MGLNIADKHPICHDAKGMRHNIDVLLEEKVSDRIACSTTLPTGLWMMQDAGSDVLHITVCIPPQARVHLNWERFTVSGNREIHVIVEEGAHFQCDIMDTSTMLQDIWHIHAGHMSQCVINHVVTTSHVREHKVFLHMDAMSHVYYHCALFIQEHAQYLHRLECAMQHECSTLRHYVHGVAQDHAAGTIESFVRMQDGSYAAESHQIIKTFSALYALWKMQPDLVIDHDNVVASHGACHGVIEPAWLAYAKTRGLSMHIFHALYLKGFLYSVLYKPQDAIMHWFDKESVFLHV